ncbi:disease resistance protein (TIR-NBS-LRR class) [Abeliophyllum distichum]|uniref:ADP-ribosyl cyclase/cyclic ADP-ribose hydrolase n=1 Tax=Abeliophyllum distichum TaxID=126358 RepID=A0ABD1Q7I7_9LAMI
MSSENDSSTSTAVTPSWRFDVFLSFRGEDTRKGFVDHLYTTLREKGIDTYKDDIELKRGRFISPELINAIESSKVALVIFSQNYADSSWCLDEIVKIVDCNKNLGQKIYPVFYYVDPSEVRKQKGNYAIAFEKYEKDPSVDKKRIEGWRNALKDAASVSGWDIQHTADGHESKGIRKIALDILNNLKDTVSRVKENLIGVESHVQQIMSLLNLESTADVRMIGIWGMGGIGKTTIARAVFDQIFSNFDGSCYLDNVREISKTLGLTSLEEKLLSDTLMEKSANLHNNTSMLFARLCHKRVLVVLDDVNEDEQLDRLAGGHDRFGAGSRIIITTRNRQLLSSREVDGVYEVSVLGTDVALKLFNKFAFKEGFPKDKFEKLARDAVKYSRGLPLALKVLGSFLHGRDVDEWENALERLNEVPEDGILEKLKVSFDALNDKEKNIFLDVACFFKGGKKENVMRKLDSFGFGATVGVSNLIQKSLLTVTNDNRLQMHNLLQETGWYIVRRPHPNIPGRYSRLWLRDDIRRVLADEKAGTEEIEGIHLDFSEPESMKISFKAFQNMNSLRLLKIHNVNIEQMPASFPSNLQWLDLHKYKTRTLPPSFRGEKLVGLKLKHSHIEHLGGLEKAELVSFLNCSKLFENPENHNAADKLLHSLLQGQPVIDGRFSILIPGREVPKSFIQNMGCSVTIPLTPNWQENFIGFAVSIVFERLVSKSKIRVTFKLISRDHGEFTPNITQTAIMLNGNCDSAHVWIGYISFDLFRRLFPKFQSDDWAKIEGCLTISTTEESWIKPKGCGIRLVYKEEVKEALAQYVETRPGNSEVSDQESSKSKEAEESIAALTYGVNQLNWVVDSAEEEGTQIQSLRNSTAYKVQKTLSFD